MKWNISKWNDIIYLLFYSEVSDRIEEYISSMMYQSETRSWICSECGKESKLKTDITRHVEAKHITNHPGYRCNYCGEYSKTKNALRVHISTRHPFKWEKMFILCIRINKLLSIVTVLFSLHKIFSLFRCLWHDWGTHFIHDVSVRDQELDLFSVRKRIQTKDRYHETCWG